MVKPLFSFSDCASGILKSDGFGIWGPMVLSWDVPLPDLEIFYGA